MKFSILICSLESRYQDLLTLLDHLYVQIKGLEDEVEILIEKDDGTLSTGAKRNILLERSEGDYIAFIDDDDLVAPNYVELIMKALEQEPDVVGMNLIMTTDGQKAERSFHSLQFDHWFDHPYPLGNGYKVYFRNPNHLNPVKREYALEARFPEITMREDRDYSQKLLPLLKSEVYIEPPIYIYLFEEGK